MSPSHGDPLPMNLFSLCSQLHTLTSTISLLSTPKLHSSSNNTIEKINYHCQDLLDLQYQFTKLLSDFVSLATKFNEYKFSPRPPDKSPALSTTSRGNKNLRAYPLPFIDPDRRVISPLKAGRSKFWSRDNSLAPVPQKFTACLERCTESLQNYLLPTLVPALSTPPDCDPFQKCGSISLNTVSPFITDPLSQKGIDSNPDADIPFKYMNCASKIKGSVTINSKGILGGNCRSAHRIPVTKKDSNQLPKLRDLSNCHQVNFPLPKNCQEHLGTTSILGPAPNYLSALPSLYSKKHIYPHSTNNLMASFNEDDEALIQRFVGLSTNEMMGPKVTVPQHATPSTDWELCLLARIISDHTTLDSSFQSTMIKAWNADPNTHFKPVMRNCYAVEFTNEEDLQLVMMGGRGPSVEIWWLSKELLSPRTSLWIISAMLLFGFNCITSLQIR